MYVNMHMQNAMEYKNKSQSNGVKNMNVLLKKKYSMGGGDRISL